MYIILSLFSLIIVLVLQILSSSLTHLPLPLWRSTTALSVKHHPVSGISFPRNFASLLIIKTYHSHLITHTSIRHFLHNYCHHLLLLLSFTPGSKPILSTNPFHVNRQYICTHAKVKHRAQNWSQSPVSQPTGDTTLLEGTRFRQLFSREIWVCQLPFDFTSPSVLVWLRKKNHLHFRLTYTWTFGAGNIWVLSSKNF